MKNIVWILFVAFSALAQPKYQSTPESYSTIKFTYLQKARFFIDEVNFYCSADFMDKSTLKDKMQKTTIDGYSYAFVPIAQLTKEEQKLVIGMFTHQNFLITGIYNKKKNKTTLEYSRPEPADDPTRALLKKLFGETYGTRINKSVEYDFDKNIKYLESGLIAKTSGFDLAKNILELEQPENKYGLYIDNVYNNVVLTNAAYPNQDLVRYISPTLPFSNTGGIEKIESRNYTIELVSVVYQ